MYHHSGISKERITDLHYGMTCCGGYGCVCDDDDGGYGSCGDGISWTSSCSTSEL